jgi:hypothetical protein
MPINNSGLRVTSTPTATSEKKNGLRESPAPRWAIIMKAKKNSIGIAAKITRR